MTSVNETPAPDHFGLGPTVRLPRPRAKRGERKARWMIDRLAKGGVEFQIVRVPPTGERGIIFPNRESHTQEQRDLAVDLVLFAIAFPRCFASLARLHADSEAQQ